MTQRLSKPAVFVAVALLAVITMMGAVRFGDPVLAEGQTAAIQFVAHRGDTGEKVFSTWESGQPATFKYGVDEAMPGLVEGLDGMNVGGRRQVTIPFAKAFGESGNENIGVPASTDIVLVIDLVAAY